MSFNDIIEIANTAYDTEDTILSYWDKEKQAVKPIEEGNGDGLAHFIVQELLETFDPAASDEEQLREAARCMTSAADQLQSVVAAMERKIEE